MRLPAAGLALTLVLTGTLTSACTLGGPTAIRSGVQTTQDSSDSTTLANADAQRALLTLGHLSDKFEVDDEEDDGEDDGADWGCLTPEDVAGDGADDVEISFSAKQEPGLPGVFNAVTAEASDAETAARAFDALGASFRKCTSVHTKGDDGTAWDFDVRTDTDGWAEGGDQQINIVAIGTVGMSGVKLPLDIRMSLVRIGEIATMVGFFDLSDTPRATRTAHQRLLRAATARLHAVLAGEKLPRTRPLLEDYEFSNVLEKLLSPTQEV
jgi:hypothetical protein